VEIFERTEIGAVRPTKGERPFRDGNRYAPASQRFASTRQIPLKKGENSPRSGGLNGFAMVMVAGGSLFERQPCREKRRLLNFVLSNCTWEDGEVVATFRQPFDLLAETATIAASATVVDQT
jgi:hypothetical protein